MAWLLGIPLIPWLTSLRPGQRAQWATHASWWWAQVLQPLHLAAFYLGGAYLDMGRRLLGLRYLFLRRLNEGPGERAEWEATDAAYALAGVLLLARTLLVAARRLGTRTDAAAATDEATGVESEGEEDHTASPSSTSKHNGRPTR